MGFSVQLFETLAWAEELLEAAAAARRPPPSPPLHRRRLRAASPAAPMPAVANAHRATELEDDRRLRPVRAGLLDVRRGPRPGLLRRPRPLRRADRRGRPALRRRRAATAWRRTSTGSSRRAGSRRRWRSPSESVAAARALGNPYWIAYALWIAGMAFSRADPGGRWRRGTRASPSCASTASTSSRASSRATRRGCTRPTASPSGPRPVRATPSTAFHRAGNVPQLIITLASVPALFERLDRFERRGHAARRDVTAAVERSTTSPSWPSSPSRAERAARRDADGGARSDRRRPRPRRRRASTPGEQIDAARRDPRRGAAGRAGRAQPARGRGAPPRRRRAHVARDRRPSCSSRRGPPSTTSRTSTRRSAPRTGPRRRAGPWQHGLTSTSTEPRAATAPWEMGSSTDAADLGVLDDDPATADRRA